MSRPSSSPWSRPRWRRPVNWPVASA
ncbi:MAG: hypothetical protein QG672_2668, partial [Pseudomonadota bacterium]|nr:hypothetical protein [Pseudomonadota bacterium]